MTGSGRLLVPDLARGAMLLLIAAANAHYWFRQDPNTSAIAETVVSGLLHLLVDGRAYPLFALLLGFGLATIAQRSIRESLAAGLDREQAERRATTLLRRRGLWLLVFGAVHALVFAQDILGTYGLITVLVAGIVAARRRRLALLLAALGCALSTSFLAAAGPEAVLARSHGLAAQALFDEHLAGVAVNLALWLVTTPATVLTSMALPSVLLGAWLAGRGRIEQPHRHRRQLAGVVLVGLVIPVTAVLPLLMSVDGTGILARVLVTWHQGPAGLLAGAAFLALVALAASRPTAGTGVLGRALAATGRRSLSAYLSQTVLLVLAAGVLRVCGIEALASVWQLTVAVVVWSVSVLVCALMERHGIRGPAERTLRHLVAAGALR
ncbi:DUF418 domain-containing protein [Nocardiopsis sp. NRRL B-16309]|uniref:DUF418 domain-containing protein n=1 Tax=Nocardiopsis sp. NRRL B-16309 TaxID=1519494 RepID=UPI0006AF7CCD|nr:DUF418 domain-containing protein [Nocardiopsis sp. NRRL B-16309]KOX14006.1 hypothetical protein ADL05_17330 [Nocardiopsis sp. NRRL B-16309]